MSAKSEAHKSILDFLDRYIAESSFDLRKHDIETINSLNLKGVSAVDYFDNFCKYFSGWDVGMDDNIVRVETSSIWVADSQFLKEIIPFIKQTRFDGLAIISSRKSFKYSFELGNFNDFESSNAYLSFSPEKYEYV